MYHKDPAFTENIVITMLAIELTFFVFIFEQFLSILQRKTIFILM